jgi:hypothetical protein
VASSVPRYIAQGYPVLKALRDEQRRALAEEPEHLTDADRVRLPVLDRKKSERQRLP